ncbi:MAG: class I mannose-6-phosphate isomerase [Bacillota bacterium]|nr:class I mannose-6-phosphate isomerase [Bacillota bacterium]
MSFMFNPYPYDDPNAVNKIDSSGIDVKSIVNGSAATAENLANAALEKINSARNCVMGFDGYATAPVDVLTTLTGQQLSLKKIPFNIIQTSDLFQDEDVLSAYLEKNNLPTDREKDPVLLYGHRFIGGYEKLFDEIKLKECIDKIINFKKTGKGVLIISGSGALCEKLRVLYDRKIYVDITPLHAILNVKRGNYLNIGLKNALEFKAMARRCYYVDFELALDLRLQLLKNGEIDDYVIGVDPLNMKLLPYATLKQVFEKGLKYPFRCRPVYLEGVWGGYSVHKLRNLPKEMKNCAWVFDMIPMEVSIVYDVEGMLLEFPFYALVQCESEKLMGKESVSKFGNYFPVRFNYDDTMHSNGNMSIQCHPGEKYVVENNGELGRQDESYYIVEAGQGARTFLGFNNGVDVEQFIADTKRSEKEGTPVDYEKYVNAVESKPGVQVMIPAGTIHASGRNQLILEIGSLTVGSYTYKMYDYLRKDLDGNPRPIHTYHGEKVLVRDRNTDWIKSNVVQEKRLARKGEGFEEYIVGEHDLLYFTLRNVKLVDKATDNTDGYFHVLALVDGEKVLVRSKAHPEYCFVQNYLDIVVVPADMGEYEIINLKPGTTAILHKTMLKH